MNNQNKSNKGGARPGAGRKKVHDEIAARDLAVSAIVSKFGSLEKGFVELLNSEEPSLVKFVWEHAVGKPAERVKLGGDGDNDAPVLVKLDARYKDTRTDNS